LQSSYRAQLDQAKTNHLANNTSLPRLAIVGIGNELNGDDAAGVLVIRQLHRSLPVLNDVLLVEGSVAPENFTSVIRQFSPDWVWLLDAAEMGEVPGTVRLVDWENTGGITAISHGLPPTLFARFLMAELGVRIFLLGIQPAVVDQFVEPTPKIVEQVRIFAKDLADWVLKTYSLL